MAEHQSQFRLQSMCRVLRVQRSGYYAWKKKPKSKRTLADESLLVKIKHSFESSQSIYGSPRVYCDLREDGVLRSGSVCLNNFPRTISGALGVYNSAELSTVADGACDVPAGAVGNSGRTNRFHSMQPLRVWAC